MKKNNKLSGLIGLAVVTILAIAVIIGSKTLTKKDGATASAEGTIDISAYENSGPILIRSASEVLAEDGSNNGYTVTVATKGFGGSIFMDVSFDKTGETITSLVINEHKETPGYGAQITEEAFLSQFKNIAAPVYLPGTTPSAASEDAEGEDQKASETAPAEEVAAGWADGTYEAKTADYDYNGFINTVKLTIAGGKITEVIWDAHNEAGELKSILSADGAYVMTEDGLTWQEQAVALAQFVIENQSIDALNVDESKKTDSVSGVSISVNEFIDLVKQCLAQASPQTIKDGTYVAEGAEYNGYTGVVTMVVENGAVTSVVWDGRSANGEYKSYLSSVGKYVMVEGNPTWKEQADALAANVIENQSLAGIVMDDSGKTDSVSGVSISIGEFVSLVEECFVKAASGASEVSEEATPVEEAPVAEAPATTDPSIPGTQMDAISGATVSSKAVADGINAAQTFIKEFVLVQ